MGEKAVAWYEVGRRAIYYDQSLGMFGSYYAVPGSDSFSFLEFARVELFC